METMFKSASAQTDRFGRPRRAILADLDQETGMTPEAVAACLMDRAGKVCAAAERTDQELARDGAQQQQIRGCVDRIRYKKTVERLDYESVRIRSQDEGLHTRAGFTESDDYMEAAGHPWPGKDVEIRMRRDYIAVAMNVPDDVVRAGNAGVKLMALTTRTGSDLCMQMLFEALRQNQSPGAVERGARAAQKARLAGKSEEEARDLAVASMAPPSRLGAAPGAAAQGTRGGVWDGNRAGGGQVHLRAEANGGQFCRTGTAQDAHGDAPGLLCQQAPGGAGPNAAGSGQAWREAAPRWGSGQADEGTCQHIMPPARTAARRSRCCYCS